MEKEKNPLKDTTVFLMIFTALLFDAIQALVGWIPLVGNILADLFSVFVFLTFFLWFWMNGIKMVTPKRLGAMVGGGVIEMIPYLNLLPAWTLVVVVLIGTTKIKEMAAKHPTLAKGAVLAGGKIQQMKTDKIKKRNDEALGKLETNLDKQKINKNGNVPEVPLKPTNRSSLLDEKRNTKQTSSLPNNEGRMPTSIPNHAIEKTNDSFRWNRDKFRFNLQKAPRESYREIEIQGGEEFREKMKEAMDFLALAPEKMAFSQAYLKRIQEAERTGMNEGNDTFEVGPMWKTSSSLYMGSGLAHEAYHSYLAHSSHDGEGNISQSAFSGKEAEQKALAFQIETLKDIEGSDYVRENGLENEVQEIIDHLAELAINPTYQDIPYEERNW